MHHVLWDDLTSSYLSSFKKDRKPTLPFFYLIVCPNSWMFEVTAHRTLEPLVPGHSAGSHVKGRSCIISWTVKSIIPGDIFTTKLYTFVWQITPLTPVSWLSSGHLLSESSELSGLLDVTPPLHRPAQYLWPSTLTCHVSQKQRRDNSDPLEARKKLLPVLRQPHVQLFLCQVIRK
jgi:hypothetical protein